MTRITMLVLGYGFLFLGVLGLFLPILQGFLFIFVGLIVLSKHAPWANRALERVRQKWPTMGNLIDKAESLAEAWIGKATNGVRRLLNRVS
ncbi:PGPGW domain-containing protein [Geminicoccus roseus]|uniref:PGPGW domain-containing protein n=1 Tax=Geminicoccus roseus TaxID=404900 RepID=UPI00040E6844|nr:PGPGW domain-containing protein [Geminicoccus roseus]